MIIMLFENARCTCDSDPIHLNAPSVAKKVDIWGEPASMVAVEKTFNSITHIREQGPATRSHSSQRWLDAS